LASDGCLCDVYLPIKKNSAQSTVKINPISGSV